MAKLVFGMNQSLDGYVDHQEFAPGPSLFRHFIEQVRDLAGSVYGRRMYEVMRYWDEDHPEWDAEERDFAAVWRSQPKWVMSRSLKAVGPNATLVEDDIEAGDSVPGVGLYFSKRMELGRSRLTEEQIPRNRSAPMTQERSPSMSRKPTARSNPGRSPQNERGTPRLKSPGLTVTTRKIADFVKERTTACGSGGKPD